MNRQAEALKLAEELLADIELSRIGAEQCILKGTRLARLVSDEKAQAWLKFELHGYDPASPLFSEFVTKTGRWADDANDKAHVVPLSRLQGMLGAERDKLAAMHSSSLSGDMIIPAQNNRHRHLDAAAEAIATIAAITSGVMAALHDFVTSTYHELLFSEIQADLFSSAQADIDARVSSMAGDVLTKIDVINERLKAGDAEAISHAMTTCRRLIDATANALYPASEGTVEVDSQPLAVTHGHVLNRLSAYAYQSEATKGRRDRIRRSLADIYNRTSKGVHEDVTPMEARFVFLQTYLTLGELVTL